MAINITHAYKNCVFFTKIFKSIHYNKDIVFNMPLEVKNVIVNATYRCEICGRLTSSPIIYKTCCMNKPIILCSRECLSKWMSEWIKNQDQIAKRDQNVARSPLRKLHL
jgi:hypothetical protein